MDEDDAQGSPWSNSWWDAAKFLCWFAVAWVKGVAAEVGRLVRRCG